MMRTLFRGLMVMPLLLLAAGCLQSDEEFTLNPDGSGKVTVSLRTLPMNLFIRLGPDQDSVPDFDLLARQEAGRTLTRAQGVEAWKDVSYGLGEDGWFWLKGTAYFKDVNTYRTDGSGEMGQASAQTGLAATIKFAKTADGGCELRMEKKEDGGKAPEKASTLTAEEVKAKVRFEKMKFAAVQPRLAAMMGDFKIKRTYHLPGAAAEVEGFTPGATPDTVIFAFDGDSLQKAMTQAAKDDALWEAEVRKAPRGPGDGMQIFGSLAPWAKVLPKAVVKGGAKPQFDYAAEVAAAKPDWQKMRADLQAVTDQGMNASSSRTAAAGGKAGAAAAPPAATAAELAKPLQNVRLSRISLELLKENWRGNNKVEMTEGDSYDLTLYADVPPGVIQVTKATLEAADTATGVSLLKEHQNTHAYKSNPNGNTVQISCSLKLPPPDAVSIKEIRGTLTLMGSNGTREEDLGLVETKKDAKGEKRNLLVRKAETQNGQVQLEFELEADRKELAELKILDENGNKLNFFNAGEGSSNRKLTRTLISQGKPEALPAKVRVIAVIRNEVQEVSAPFSIKDVPVYGPM